MQGFRIEADSPGEVQVVPAGAYYGAQTARAVDNFPISGLVFPLRFMEADETQKAPTLAGRGFLPTKGD